LERWENAQNRAEKCDGALIKAHLANRRDQGKLKNKLAHEG